MSSSRDIENNRFRNASLIESLSFPEFQDLLATFFPRRDLSAPVDSKWAWDFFKGMDSAFKKAEEAEFWERWKRRPADQLISKRLADIQEAALRLRELLTGEKAACKEEKPEIDRLSCESSHSIRYWMTYAIGRDANEFDRFVRVLPKVTQAAMLGLEQIEAEGRHSDDKPTARGRPKELFKDGFLVEAFPIWKEFSDRPATFESSFETEQPCPFCDFCAKYLFRAGISDDTAEALAVRYQRAIANRE